MRLTTLTRWNQLGFGGLDHELSALNDLRNRMDRLFLEFERGWGQGRDPGAQVGWTSAAAWPRIALYDSRSELRLRADVPGLSDKDLEISVEQSSLTIRANARPRPRRATPSTARNGATVPSRGASRAPAASTPRRPRPT